MRIHFIQHVAYENPGYLLQWASDNQHHISFTKIFEAAAFPSPDDFDWLIVMGGPMGVYEAEKYEWLEAEIDFIRSAIDTGKKVLGICLGSQLVASALGARVYPHTQKEIGWYKVKKTSAGKTHPLLASLPDEWLTFHWHGDTFDLPAGAVHLLQSEACPHQAYLYNDQVMGLQFHMEATPELVKTMVENGRPELVPSTWTQSEKEILENNSLYIPNNYWIDQLLSAFIQEKSYHELRNVPQ